MTDPLPSGHSGWPGHIGPDQTAMTDDYARVLSEMRLLQDEVKDLRVFIDGLRLGSKARARLHALNVTVMTRMGEHDA